MTSRSNNLDDALALAFANVQWTHDNMEVLMDWLAAKNGIKPSTPARTPAEPTTVPTVPPVPPTAGPGPTEPPGPAGSDTAEWRLPSSVVPLHYELMMVPFLEPRHFQFEGRVTILLKVVEATSNIVLHSQDLDVPTDTLSVTDSMGEDQEVAGLSFDTEKSFLTISMTSPLKAGAQYNLSIEFSAPLRTDNFGFYVSSYVVENEVK